MLRFVRRAQGPSPRPPVSYGTVKEPSLPRSARRVNGLPPKNMQGEGSNSWPPRKPNRPRGSLRMSGSADCGYPNAAAAGLPHSPLKLKAGGEGCVRRAPPQALRGSRKAEPEAERKSVRRTGMAVCRPREACGVVERAASPHSGVDPARWTLHLYGERSPSWGNQDHRTTWISGSG